MKKLQVRASILRTLFIVVLAAFLFMTMETAIADDKQRITPITGFVAGKEGSIPYDGEAEAGTDRMCSIQAYLEGDAIEMNDDNTIFLPPDVCEDLLGYILIQFNTGELKEQQSH